MIRYQVRQRIAALLADEPELANVNVWPAYPGDKHQTTQMIFGDRTSGPVEFPYSEAGDKTSRDTFDAVFVVRVSGLGSLDECALRCEEITRTAVQTIASTGLTLDEFVADDEKVCEVGPLSVQTREGDTDKGAVALAEITLSIETQTT